jgi:hypothetical protein
MINLPFGSFSHLRKLKLVARMIKKWVNHQDLKVF